MRKKRILSLLLSLVVCIAFMPTAVFATGGGTAITHTVTVNAGDYGEVSTDETNWSKSVRVQVTEGATLGDSVKYRPNEGYKAGSVTAPVVIKKIVASDVNTAAIDVDGNLYTAGDNSLGQLGRALGKYEYSDYILTKVDLSVKITDVAAGAEHTVILDKNGEVWTAGSNQYGALGTDEYVGKGFPWGVNVFKKVTVGEGTVKIKAVAAGLYHTILIDETGGVWTAGSNSDGQLGRNTNTDSKDPVFKKVDGLENVKIVSAAGGFYHTILLDDSGNVWTAGTSAYGVLGRQTLDASGAITSNPTFEMVTDGISGVKITAIAAGNYHNVLLDENGNVWTVGSNENGELGRKPLDWTNSEFKKADLQGDVTAKFVAAGSSCTIVIDTAGKVRTCGLKSYGQLGWKPTEDENPDLLEVTEGIGGMKMIAADAGAYYSILLDENGGIWSCGINSCGQLCREENFGKSTGNYTFTAVTDGMSQNITFNEMKAYTIKSDITFTINAEERDDRGTVEYDLNNGSWVDGFTPKNYYYWGDGQPELPDADKLVRTGYTFDGWESSGAQGSLKYTAKWKINQYTITFNTGEGSQIAPITQDYDTDITAPANPTREGYEFVGWDKAIPETMPAENLTITANWKDITEPTGEISIGEKKWTELLNNITFDLFFKDTQEVTIKAEDNSGEAVKIAYLLSNKSLTSEELAESTFTEYSEPFAINLDNEYIIYAKLTDAANNTKYICSNGIVLDKTAPVIAGVENGKTYCSAQTVTITEKYIDSVTVNQQDVQLDGNTFTLKPSDDMQEIVVTDKAGNTSAKMIVKINNGHTFVNNECSVCGYKRPAGGGSLVQKPEIITGEGGKTSLENNGTTLVITPDEGMEISKVTVNGKEVTVTDNKLTGLKTGDKVEVIFAKIPPTKEEIDNIFKGKALKLELIVRTSKTPKKNIKAVVKETAELNDLIKEIKDAGYTVKYKFYRSVKKSSKYEARLTKTEGRYINTIGKKGTKYYYKAKLLIYDTEGNLVAQTELKQCKYGLRTWSK